MHVGRRGETPSGDCREERPLKTALITGISGQDGSYLAELLLSKGYRVCGTVRRHSVAAEQDTRIAHIRDKIETFYADMTDSASLYRVLLATEPDEIYNLAAQSHVRVSFDQPAYTFETIALGTINLLDAVTRIGKPAKFYQASSSEMFGSSPPPQNEQTPFKPKSPYAVAKVAAFHSVVNAREQGLFACNGILFNHESPRRGETFVTRKITLAAARIKSGLQDKLHLGNLRARRDWGHARDYVEAMWLMLQHEQPADYVISTEQSWSIINFLEEAFGRVDLKWEDYVCGDERLLRPTEVDHLRGDSSKAVRILGWKPAVSFQDLVSEMVEHDMVLAEREAACLT